MNSDLALMLFGGFFLLLAMGLPIAVCLALSSLASIVSFNLGSPQLLPQLMTSAVNSWTLLAIPFFILAGNLLGQSELSRRLINLAEALIGNVAGGLAIVTVMVGLFLAGISGSGPAGTAALGSLLIPAMVASGYDRRFAASVTAASGGIGIIFPPSIALIIYGLVAQNVSIGRLFIAGIIPGIVVAASLVVAAYILAKRRGYRAKRSRGSLREVARAFKEAFWGLLAPVIILGGIHGGIFTPTEAAAVAVFYSLFVGFVIYRDLRWSTVWRILCESAATTATVMYIVAAASLFAYVLTVGQLASGIAAWLVSVAGSRLLLLLLVNIVLLIAGTFMDAISIYYIFVPIFLPALLALGVDPLHFGIIASVNLTIGLITPPVGVNLFVAAPLAKIRLGDISVGIIPFILAMLVALLLINVFPGLSLWLPSLM